MLVTPIFLVNVVVMMQIQILNYSCICVGELHTKCGPQNETGSTQIRGFETLCGLPRVHTVLSPVMKKTVLSCTEQKSVCYTKLGAYAVYPLTFNNGDSGGWKTMDVP